MKFLISKKLSKKSAIFPPLVGMLLFFLIGIGFNLTYIHFKISLLPQNTVEYILGNEEAFIEPILPEELLAIIHIELVFFMFVLPLLFFTYYRLYQNSRTTKEFIFTFSLLQIALFALAFSQIGDVFLVYLFSAAFIMGNGMLVYIVIRTFLKLIRNG